MRTLAKILSTVSKPGACLTLSLCYGGPCYGDIFGLTYRGSVSWWNSFQHSPVLEDSFVNPQNLALGLAEDRYSSELRPNLKFVSSSLQLILRPRLRYALSLIKKGEGPSDLEKTKVDTFVSEAFFQWTLNDSLTFALGAQSYQWGAAEVLSPSNRIFHETAQDRTNLFEVRGRYIARANVSLGKRFSLVVMSEVLENKDNVDIRTYSAEETWYPTVLIKPEINWNNGADYFGIVIGNKEKNRPWVGQYFSYGIPFFEGLTFYADSAHERGSNAWYPQISPLGPTQPSVISFARSKKDDTSVSSLAISGLRYDFEDGAIVRAEYIHNDAAYTKDERNLALASFQSAVPEQLALRSDNTQRFLAPGIELPGRRLVYLSAYVPNPFSLKDLIFFARGLRSLSDQSGTYYGSIDYTVGDSGTISYAYSLSAGPIDGEAKGFSSPLHIIAYRHDW